MESTKNNFELQQQQQSNQTSTPPTFSKKFKDYKTPIKKKLRTTSLQFFLKPFRSSRLTVKLFWTLFLILSILYSVYNLFLNIFDYLNYDVTTSFDTIIEHESQFPTISFCSEYDTNFHLDLLEFKFNYRNLLANWKNHFEIYTDTSYGRCYRFNSGKNTSNQAIEIENSKKNELFDGLQLKFYSNTTFDFGSLLVYIHNHTKMLNTIINKAHYVSSGCENYFTVKRIFENRLEYPYNECYKNVSNSSANKTIINFLNDNKCEYTQRECIRYCRNLLLNETNNCSCHIQSLNEFYYFKCLMKMNDTKIKDCVENLISNFEVNNCSKYCPLECDSNSYEIAQSVKPILANGNISSHHVYYSRFKTYENLTKTYYSLNVYYEELKYTLITEKPRIELYGLASSIGGTFSLFLGLSVGSFLEFVDILTELIVISFFE